MMKIEFIEGLIKLLSQYSGRSEKSLHENWHTLLEVHGYDFNRAIYDLVSSTLVW